MVYSYDLIELQNSFYCAALILKTHALSKA